MKTNFQTHSVT